MYVQITINYFILIPPLDWVVCSGTAVAGVPVTAAVGPVLVAG